MAEENDRDNVTQGGAEGGAIGAGGGETGAGGGGATGGSTEGHGGLAIGRATGVTSDTGGASGGVDMPQLARKSTGGGADKSVASSAYSCARAASTGSTGAAVCSP